MSKKTKKSRSTNPRKEEPHSNLKRDQSPAPRPGAGRRVFAVILVGAGVLLLVFWRFVVALPKFDFRGYNLVILTLDTTRADHVGAYGYDKIRTPNLDQLASDGYLFQRAISQAPLTLPSHTTIFTGTFPAHHGVRDNGGFFVSPANVTLAEALKERGYRTAAFVSSFVLDSKWGLNQGFDTYFDDFDIAKADQTGIGEVQRQGGQTNETALKWLQQTDAGSPFFAWIHYYDPHEPYEPPEPYRTEYAGRLYDGEIAYADMLVGQVLDTLKSRDLLKKTIVVVASDHGEGLGEHHEETHGVFIYREALRVPLIVKLPVRASGVIAQTVRLADIMPTVLDLLEVEKTPQIQGRSLVPLMRKQTLPEIPALSESRYSEFHYGWSPLYSISIDAYQFILSPKPELYNIDEDPGEKNNLYSSRRPLAKTMEERLLELQRQYSASGQEKSSSEMSVEDQEILKSLGYIGSGPSEKMKEAGKSIDPKDKIGLVESLHLAFADLHAARYEEARQKVEKIIAEDPEMVDAHFIQGMIATNQEKYPEAVRAFQDTLSLRPDHLFALFNLAVVFRKTGETQKAVDGFQQVLRHDPHYVYAMINLAELYAAQKDSKKASEYYRDAVERYRQMLQSSTTVDAIASIHDTLSGVYFSEGRLDEAEKEILEIIKIKPGHPDAHYNLAQIYESRGEAPAAEKEYREEIRYNPSNNKAYNDLSVLLWESKEFNRAIPVLRDLLRLQADNYAACYMLADCLLQTGGDLREAKSLAERSVQLHPQFQRGIQLLAEINRRTAQ